MLDQSCKLLQLESGPIREIYHRPRNNCALKYDLERQFNSREFLNGERCKNMKALNLSQAPY